MSESTSDALFGADGTQPPELLPDPPTGLGRGTWQGAPELPIYVPPVLDDSALREAIAAALADDPTGPVDLDRAAAPAPPAEPGGSPAPQSDSSPGPQPGGAPGPQSGGAPGPQSGGAPAPQPGGSPVPAVGPASQGVGLHVPGQPHASTGVSSSPLISPMFPSASSRPRRSAGQRYRPPMAAAFRRPMPPADLRRRVGRDRPGVPRQTPANLALGAGLFVALIIAVALIYNIITGFLESISRLVP